MSDKIRSNPFVRFAGGGPLTTPAKRKTVLFAEWYNATEAKLWNRS
jgi:hypothetical protein